MSLKLNIKEACSLYNKETRQPVLSACCKRKLGLWRTDSPYVKSAAAKYNHLPQKWAPELEEQTVSIFFSITS
jgi:hypothetical protein